MSNLPARPKDFCGRPATGATVLEATSGLPACGSHPHIQVCFGRPATGDLWAAPMDGTGAIGDRTWDSTAELTMGLATAALDSTADAGTADTSCTTRRRGMSALAFTASTRIAASSVLVNTTMPASTARAVSTRLRLPANVPR